MEAVKKALENIRLSNAQANVFITLEKEDVLMHRAFQSQKRHEQGKALGMLDGMIVSIKDNINTSFMRTTCGSNVLRSFIPPFDATVVSRLVEQGALIIGKTNMDEFGMGSHNIHSAFGACSDRRTLNERGFGRSFGGSSGGAAASVALGCSQLALGTDSGGSVRLPAAYSGLIGFKPSYGAISRHGVIPYAHSLDTVGILGTSIADVFGLFGT